MNNNSQEMNKSDMSKPNFLPQINTSSYNGSQDGKHDIQKTPYKKSANDFSNINDHIQQAN
jgi:hypothetical protein